MGPLIKNKLGKEEIEKISYLLEPHSHLLVYSRALSAADCKKYFIESINYSLYQNKKNRLFILRKRGISGMAQFRFMDWDSNFFKMPIACIEHILIGSNQGWKETYRTEKELLRECIDFAKKSGIKVLYTTIDAAKHSLINSLSSLRFNFICSEIKGLIKRKDTAYLNTKEEIGSSYKFRRYKEEDSPQVMSIGKEITRDLKSKFSLMPYLPQEEKTNYYLESIKNCCLGLNADDMFIIDKNNITVGFVCYRNDKIFEAALGRRMSFLVMGGVLGLERRKNIGTYLFGLAHKHILKKSDFILWKAYLHNLPIVRFILNRGFMPAFEIEHTFCKRL